MSTRKKPQQQLASYFDELLTELDAPTDEAYKPLTSSDNNKAAQDLHSVKASLATKPSAPIISSQVDAVPTAVIPKPQVVMEAHVENTVEATIDTKTETIEEQVQKEKLQRLLRNLLPDITTLLPEEQKAIEEKLLTQEPSADDAPVAVVKEVPHQWQAVTKDWLDNGRPSWAQETFDIMLLKVQGVNIAVPLAALDAIYPIEEKLTPLFGQAEWFMGLQKTQMGNIKVIDTAQFIMPERYKKQDESSYKYSVAINGSGWSLAVDEIYQPLVTYPEDIRWRVNRSKRPWVAGTATEHMCILLDIPRLAELLNKNK
jgi:purine-binding chemotaxis protein CheW